MALGFFTRGLWIPALACGLGGWTSTHAAVMVAGWDFQALVANQTIPLSSPVAADVGSARMVLLETSNQFAVASGVSPNGWHDPAVTSNIKLKMNIPVADTRVLELQNLDLRGLEKPVVSLAVRPMGLNNSAQGHNQLTVGWSVDGLAWQSVAPIALILGGWNVASVDLSGVSALANAPAARLRLSFSGAAVVNGEISYTDIDNLKVMADPVVAAPEPGTGLACVAGIVLLARRRRA